MITLKGWEIISGDCFGSLHSWDVRGQSCSGQWNLGFDAVNSIAVDPARTVYACATDSNAITLVDPTSSKVSVKCSHYCPSLARYPGPVNHMHAQAFCLLVVILLCRSGSWKELMNKSWVLFSPWKQMVCYQQLMMALSLFGSR